jgi:pyruvate formate lyase activating enzyme
MKIAGIEKTTLIDYPGKIACTIFIYGCNFRCKFCHNPELVILPLKKEIPVEEILQYLEKRKGQLEGVCITGGEPLLSIDEFFLKEIKKRGYAIKMDTNGSFPEKLEELIRKKLIDFIAMDIKADKENYLEIIDSKLDLTKIEKSIRIILNSGLDYELRITLLEDFHSIESLKSMCEWIKKISEKKPKKICLQGFKNKEKILNQEYANKKDTSLEYLKRAKEEIKDYFEEVEIRI